MEMQLLLSSFVGTRWSVQVPLGVGLRLLEHPTPGSLTPTVCPETPVHRPAPRLSCAIEVRPWAGAAGTKALLRNWALLLFNKLGHFDFSLPCSHGAQGSVGEAVIDPK